MKYIFFIIIFLITSCSFHTDISYRIDKNDKYIREDGFMVSCNLEGNFLIVGTYTPESWGKDFYYGYLEGTKSERKLKITSVDVLLIETADTLILKEIRDEREFVFTSSNLNNPIDSNKQLKIRIHIKDIITNKIETKEFILKRRKHTYPTSNFPHA